MNDETTEHLKEQLRINHAEFQQATNRIMVLEDEKKMLETRHKILKRALALALHEIEELVAEKNK